MRIINLTACIMQNLGFIDRLNDHLKQSFSLVEERNVFI